MNLSQSFGVHRVVYPQRNTELHRDFFKFFYPQISQILRIMKKRLFRRFAPRNNESSLCFSVLSVDYFIKISNNSSAFITTLDAPCSIKKSRPLNPQSTPIKSRPELIPVCKSTSLSPI